MATDNNINLVEHFFQTILAEEPLYFLVSVKIKPTNNIKVFLDGDSGLPIEKCVYFNRKLYKMIEEAGIYPEGEFSLEVSSPGIEEPLKLIRQYQKNIGRTIQVVFTDDTIKEGILETVAEADIMIQCTTGKGKKAVTEQVLIPFSNIKSTTVQIKF